MRGLVMEKIKPISFMRLVESDLHCTHVDRESGGRSSARPQVVL